MCICPTISRWDTKLREVCLIAVDGRAGEGVEPAIIQRLAELVGHGCNTSQTAMRAEGVKVLRLMSQDVAHLSRINCLRQCNKWTSVLQVRLSYWQAFFRMQS